MSLPPTPSNYWISQQSLPQYGRVKSRVLVVTPDMARWMLERNPENRSIRPVKVKQLVNDIQTGRWVFNGEPIIISDDWQLNDGQHRLTAVIEADIPVVMLVVTGVPRETRTTVDQGAARSAGDYMGMSGTQNSNLKAAIARAVLAYQASGGSNINNASLLTNSKIIEWVDKNSEAVDKAVHFAFKNRDNIRHYTAPAVLGASHFILSRLDTEAADDYMNQVITGEDISIGDPAYAVRNTLLNLGKSSRQKNMEVIFRGWVKYRRGENLKIVKVMGEFPDLK